MEGSDALSQRHPCGLLVEIDLHAPLVSVHKAE
jgi:hypothetical protein